MTMHPLRKLLNYAAAYRSDFQKATLYSVLNKFFDILPEVLIGAAVDVVVKGEQSFLARNVLGGLGITSTWEQLLALGAFNVVVWGGESLFQYLYEVQWRQLAQNLQHALQAWNTEECFVHLIPELIVVVIAQPARQGMQQQDEGQPIGGVFDRRCRDQGEAQNQAEQGKKQIGQAPYRCQQADGKVAVEGQLSGAQG